MLDLKAKLAAAGLVTKEDVERAERGRKGKQASSAKPAQDKRPRLPVKQLRGKPKGEIYDAVRRFVERVREDDPSAPPSDTARTFHFPTALGKAGRLVLEPDLATKIEGGDSAVVAFMSNHGLAHAVVPAAAGVEIAEIMPLWLRVLVGDDRAGKLDERVATPRGSDDSG